MGSKIMKVLSLCFMIGLLLVGCQGTPNMADTQTLDPGSPAVSEATVTTVPTQAPAPTATTAPTQAEAGPAGPATEGGRIAFAPNTTEWQTPGDLDPNAAIQFTLSASKGQQMNIWLTTEPASSNDAMLATLDIRGADGSALTVSPSLQWSSILPTSQDYEIEVRSLAQEPISYSLVVEIPAAVIDPALGTMYEPIPTQVCFELQKSASEALGMDFWAGDQQPFLDPVGGEAGLGCSLVASGPGNTFGEPAETVAKLVNSVGLGWTPQTNYQADGPTGSATGLARDMALMLISVQWKPAMGITCPGDQPINECGLTPEQKMYTVNIDIAQYRADFSLDGHWEDASTGFILDLYQDWKNIWGQHSVVAQGGNKIDSMEASINGSLKGKVATVTFQSSFTSEPGTAEITYVDVNTITWKIIAPPGGEFYLPAEATLTRK
jgi:hypothetical protein